MFGLNMACSVLHILEYYLFLRMWSKSLILKKNERPDSPFVIQHNKKFPFIQCVLDYKFPFKSRLHLWK